MKIISNQEVSTKTVEQLALQCQDKSVHTSKYFEKLIMQASEELIEKNKMFKQLEDKLEYLLAKSWQKFYQFVFKKSGEGTFTVRYYRGNVVTIGAPEFKSADVKTADNLLEAFDYCKFHGYSLVKVS